MKIDSMNLPMSTVSVFQQLADCVYTCRQSGVQRASEIKKLTVKSKRCSSSKNMLDVSNATLRLI